MGNRRWMEYSGQTLEETVGYGWTNAVHPDDREQALRVFRESMEADKPFRHQYRIRRADEIDEDGRKGFGLASVRERLGFFGGTLEIDSAPGRGTRITIVVRLDRTDK